VLKILEDKEDVIKMEIGCADCGCKPSECKESISKGCPNCTWEECCCWAIIYPA